MFQFRFRYSWRDDANGVNIVTNQCGWPTWQKLGMICQGNVFRWSICTLFSILLDSGLFLETWSWGINLPMYKNKGNEQDPNTYRGITSLSCFAKLFTNIQEWMIELPSLKLYFLYEERTGFRKNYSTVDRVLLEKC